MANSSKELDLLRLKDDLNHGDIAQIAKKLNFSQRHIHLVLKGDRTNSEILKAVVEKVKANRRFRRELTELIENY